MGFEEPSQQPFHRPRPPVTIDTLQDPPRLRGVDSCPCGSACSACGTRTPTGSSGRSPSIPRSSRWSASTTPTPKVVAERRRSSGRPRSPGFRVFDKPEQLLHEQLDGVVVEGRVHENLQPGPAGARERPAGDAGEAGRRQPRRVSPADRPGPAEAPARADDLPVPLHVGGAGDARSASRKGELGRIYEFRARLPKDLRVVQALRRGAGAVQGRHVLRDGRPRHRHDGRHARHAAAGDAVPGPSPHASRRRASSTTAWRSSAIDHAWGIIEVPALEVAPHSRRIEVYGTEGACVIPHLGSGHLANKNIQPIEVYRAGQTDWQTHRAAGADAADRRPARVRRRRRRQEAARLQHGARPGGAGDAAARQRDAAGEAMTLRTISLRGHRWLRRL